MQRFKRDFQAGRLAEFWCENIMFNDCCCIEPTLDELLGDTTVRLLMRRDGVTESEVRALLCELKNAQAVGLCATKRGRRDVGVLVYQGIAESG